MRVYISNNTFMIRDNKLGRVTEDRSDGIFPDAVDYVCLSLIDKNSANGFKQR
jgi:hypothetical protein